MAHCYTLLIVHRAVPQAHRAKGVGADIDRAQASLDAGRMRGARGFETHQYWLMTRDGKKYKLDAKWTHYILVNYFLLSPGLVVVVVLS